MMLLRQPACCRARAVSRHSFGALIICYQLPRYKPAVPWEPEVASRLLAATVAAVRAARAKVPLPPSGHPTLPHVR